MQAVSTIHQASQGRLFSWLVWHWSISHLKRKSEAHHQQRPFRRAVRLDQVELGRRFLPRQVKFMGFLQVEPAFR